MSSSSSGAQSSQTPAANKIQATDLYNRVQSARQDTVSILQSTEWPSESKAAAQGLLDAINTCPDIPKSISNGTGMGKLVDSIEKTIQVLEDVHTRLKKVSEKYGTKERGLRDQFKHRVSSFRKSKCLDTLQACLKDISAVLAPLRVSLDNEASRGEVAAEGSEVAPEALAVPPMPLPTSSPFPEPPTTPADSQTAASPLTPNNQGERRLIRGEALNLARKTFKTVEVASGIIPVVGSYVGAAAKVGLAFVESIQTMDKNDDLAGDLWDHTSKLSSLLERFKSQTSPEPGDELAIHVNDLHRELLSVREKVEKWSSLGRFKKAFSSSDHAEALKEYQQTIQTALEEMQLLASLNTTDIMIELKNAEVRKEQRRLLDRLGDAKYGARGNTIEEVICLTGTRVDILERIDSWIRDTSSSNRVLWIRGMAGRGKSTIASTVVHSWKYRASCAIFHFRRGQNTLNTRIICALARQLGRSLVPEIKQAILQSVQENEDIADQRLDEQFKTLLVAPLGRLSYQSHPVLIVVDALDEWEASKDAVAFVKLVDRHSSLFPANVKFLLTCRPEAALVRALEPREWNTEDLDSVTSVTHDLRRFFQHTFARIRDDDDSQRTGLLQKIRNAYWKCLKRPAAWRELDDLYHQILSKAFDAVKLDPIRTELLSWILGSLVVAPNPISLEVIATLYRKHAIFHGMDLGDIIQSLHGDILADLNSLLRIPPSSAEPMRLMHTSIHDLLVNQQRCEQRAYFIHRTLNHKRLATVCLDLMQRDLKQNICNISDLSTPNSDIQDVVERNVSKAIQYCCRSWSIHLTDGVLWSESNAETSSIQLAALNSFSKEKLMFWIEVMSLVGATAEAILVSRNVHRWLLVSLQPALAERGDGRANLVLIAMSQRDIRLFPYSTVERYPAVHRGVSGTDHVWGASDLLLRSSSLPGGDETLRVLWQPLDNPPSAWPTTRNLVINLWTRSVGSGVVVVAFSPTGKFIATGSNDGGTQLWAAQTGAPLVEIAVHQARRTLSVAFSPDGKILATGSVDRMVRLWDPETGVSLKEPLSGHKGSITSIAFSPNSKVLASGSQKDVWLWDAQTGVALGEPLLGHRSVVQSLAFSPDGKTLASSSNDQTIQIWDASTGAKIFDPLAGHTNIVRSVAFSPDGKLLASGSDDCTIRLWDTQAGTAVGEPLTGQGGWVSSIAFSPDGTILASGCSHDTIQLWNTQTWTRFGEALTGHNGWVRSVSFSPDGKFLASGAFDNTVRLWDMQTVVGFGTPPKGDINDADSITSYDIGESKPESDYQLVRLLDPRVGTVLRLPRVDNTAQARPLAFSPIARIVASDSGNDTIRLWDTRTGEEIATPLTGHKDKISCLTFSPDGRLLASASCDGVTQLWDIQTEMKFGGPLTGHNDCVHCITFSPNGRILASGSADQDIRLWDVHTTAALGDPLRGHTSSVLSITFSPDGKTFASMSDDGAIRLWDTDTAGSLGGPLTHQESPSRSKASYKGEKTPESEPNVGTVQLHTQARFGTLGKPLPGQPSGIISVAFSPDGKILASGYSDSTVRLWDVLTRTPIGEPLRGHGRSISFITFSPDGKMLASISQDETIRLWDTKTHESLDEPFISYSSGFKDRQRIRSFAFSSNIRLTVAYDGDDSIFLWDICILETSVVHPALSNRFGFGFHGQWLTSLSKRLFWFPAQYWETDYPEIALSGGLFAFVHGKMLSVFDVSRVLRLSSTSNVDPYV